MKDRDGFEYTHEGLVRESDETRMVYGKPRKVRVRYFKSIISPARQAKKKLELSGRQLKKIRKALRRKPKVTFTGPELTQDTEGLVDDQA